MARLLKLYTYCITAFLKSTMCTSRHGNVQFISAKLATAWMLANSYTTLIDVHKSAAMWA